MGQADADRASLPSQRAVNRQTAERYGLVIVRTIEIAGVSGTAVLFAPEMQEMIRLMSDSEIHGVVTREFSRLMRPENFSDYALLQAFADSKTILYLPDGPIDLSSKTGRLLGGLQALIGGMERTEILERIWNAKEVKRRQGDFGQSRACLPFGVAYDKSGWHYTNDSERVKEAFTLLLRGQTSYGALGKIVNIEPKNLRVILRNPIYTGWRVIDQKRDPSPAGKYATKNGRQGDRRKIKRAPEDVIRVQVIKEPLISEEEFNQAQRIMDLKKQNHWRMNDATEHRFVYNGFLSCTCGARLRSLAQWADYYGCKDKCGVKYQRRDVLDPHLDRIFAKRLTSPSFLRRHVMPGVRNRNLSEPNSERITNQIKTLSVKRQRILDAYFEGVISDVERATRIGAVDKERSALEAILARERPQADLTLQSLVDTFAPFVEFDLLNREDKRALLTTLTPEIVVANYEVKGMFIGGVANRTDAASHAFTRTYLKLGLKAA